MFHCNYCDLGTACIDELDIHILETHTDFQSTDCPPDKLSNQIFPVSTCSDLQSNQPDMQISVNPGQGSRVGNKSDLNEDLIHSSHVILSVDHFQMSGEYPYGCKAFKEYMNPSCETVGKLGTLEDSNKQVAHSNTNGTFAIEQVTDVYSIACDNECNKPNIFNKESELDQCLLKDTTLPFKTAEEPEMTNLGHTQLHETTLGVTKETDLRESLLFLPLDGGWNMLPKQTNPDKPNKDGTEMEVDGKLVAETGKMSCLWCECDTFNKQCFEGHTKEQHSYFGSDEETPISTMELEYLGCKEQDFNSQVDSMNYASRNAETIVRESELCRTECENRLSKSNSDNISITGGRKPSKNMRQKSVTHPTFRQNVRRILKLKNSQTVFYVKRLCLFHCVICRFHTLYRRCVLRHVRRMHHNHIRSPKLKGCVRFSNGLSTLKLCKKDCTLKKLTLKRGPLPLERKCSRVLKPDRSVRSENVNLMPFVANPSVCPSKSDITESKNCLRKQHINPRHEASLVQQINDQIQFSVPYLLANDSDVKTSSEIPKDPPGATSHFSPLMTSFEKITYGDLNIKTLPPSSKCLALEAIVENLKSRVASPIKCRPTVALLNDRIAKPRRSIPFCRTTEEQQAKWVMEAYSFLKQQKIERAAEFSSCDDDDCLLDAMAEIEVVLSDTDDDNSNYSQVCRNYGTSNVNFAKATEDKREILSLASSAKMEPGNVCTRLNKCDICPFSSSNIMSVLSHYHRQHPEENIPYHRIQKYSCKMTVQTGLDLPLPKHSLFWFDSKSADSVIPCFTGSSALCFCEHCSFSGDWVSLFEHYQKSHTSTNITKYGGQKESERKNVSNLQVRAPLASTSSSEPQVVFQCQLCNFTCSSRRVICRHYCIRQSVTCAQVEDFDILYKCALCVYTHLTQEGLINHYLVYHDIEPQFSSRGIKTGQNELVSFVSSDEDLKAGMEKQICMLCSFKAITQKELLFHYKLRHPRFYSQNRCTIECKNHANLHITNLDPQFCEAKHFKNGSECVKTMLEWGMSVVNTKEPSAFGDGSELELINCKRDRDLIMAVPAREHPRNQNNSPIHYGQKVTMAANSLDVTRLPSKQFPLNRPGSRSLEYDLMPGKQNVDSSDIFCEFGDPVNKITVQESIFGAEDDWQQRDLV
ncbi:uncharacterized protein LOC125486434 [Rhincodon typus]|uniref:uncharacterized protein LOC125486434 n=1 Tax=Rhincodon typus TaxID=259920 RepID=UPI00202E42AF|nr:uncharacterized protein LOC125486434 [Rhincodon typus]